MRYECGRKSCKACYGNEDPRNCGFEAEFLTLEAGVMDCLFERGALIYNDHDAVWSFPSKARLVDVSTVARELRSGSRAVYERDWTFYKFGKVIQRAVYESLKGLKKWQVDSHRHSNGMARHLLPSVYGELPLP